MDKPVIIGLDFAENVFQVHGVDTEGVIVCPRQLRRSQVLAFFHGWSPASSASKPAPALITGRGS